MKKMMMPTLTIHKYEDEIKYQLTCFPSTSMQTPQTKSAQHSASVCILVLMVVQLIV